jgi:hypothetical protein
MEPITSHTYLIWYQINITCDQFRSSAIKRRKWLSLICNLKKARMQSSGLRNLNDFGSNNVLKRNRFWDHANSFYQRCNNEMLKKTLKTILLLFSKLYLRMNISKRHIINFIAIGISHLGFKTRKNTAENLTKNKQLYLTVTSSNYRKST